MHYLFIFYLIYGVVSSYGLIHMGLNFPFEFVLEVYWTSLETVPDQESVTLAMPRGENLV